MPGHKQAASRVSPAIWQRYVGRRLPGMRASEQAISYNHTEHLRLTAQVMFHSGGHVLKAPIYFHNLSKRPVSLVV